MKVNFQLLGIGAGVLAGEWALRRAVNAIGKTGLGLLWAPGENYTWDDLTTTNTGLANVPGPVGMVKVRALAHNILDPLWDAVGPVTVTSGYRSPAVNRKVGGDSSSQHMTGEAADIKVPGYTALQLAKKIHDLGLPYDKLIWYPASLGGHVHVSYTKTPRGDSRHAAVGGGYPPWSFA